MPLAEDNLLKRTRVPLNAIALAVFFTVMSAFALYAAIQNAMPYWLAVHGQLSTGPSASPADVVDRATSNASLLRLSAWPALAFAAFQLVAIISVTRLFPRRRGTGALLRWTSSMVVATMMSGLFLFSIWTGFEGMTNRWNRWSAVEFGVVNEKPANR